MAISCVSSWASTIPSCNNAAGTDRAFRMFSSIQDQQSTELSQHHVERRAKRLKITQQELKLPG